MPRLLPVLSPFLFAALLAAESAPPPPVVLVNGYQFPPCAGLQSKDTFGQLEEKLKATGRTVIWFNNCSVPAQSAARPTIEEMGRALGEAIAASGAPQVDVVVHSMGGLILRSYLAGKQNEPGAFAPPAATRVRRAVFLGTPHFGPGFADVLRAAAGGDPQVAALLPGSRFLWDLATWNLGGDDLHGVDAIAVAGTSAAMNEVNNSGDGLVLSTSASLQFAVGPGRLRTVPYCHTNVGLLALLAAACRQPPYLADVESDDHLSWRILRSFFDGTDEWKTLGGDPGSVLAAQGGLLLSYQDQDGNPANATTAITAGGAALSKGDWAWYRELLPAGPAPIQATSAAATATASVTIAAGGYNVAVVKTGPRIATVLPAAGVIATRSRAPGMFLSIYGGDLAASAAQAASLPLPVTLGGAEVRLNGAAIGLQYAGPTQINAVLPDDATGLVTLEVRTPAGRHQIRVLVDGPTPAVFTQTGTGAGLASALHAVTGALVTPASRLRAGEIAAVYLTGLGATELRGGLHWARELPAVTVGGVAAEVQYAGRAPGYAGLDQINFVIPSGAPTGDAVELRIAAHGNVSNVTTLPIE